MIRIVCIAAAVLMAATAWADEADARDVLVRAEAAFDRGTAALADDPTAGRSHFAEAAADYALAIEQLDGIRPKLQFNLGNALLLAGDVGGAVLAYRRAEMYAPTLPRLRDTLDATRRRVAVELSPTLGERMLGMLLSWRGVVPRWALLAISFAAFAGLWIAASVRLLKGVRAGPALVAWLAALAVLPLGLLVLERVLLLDRPHAVVVALAGVEGLNGPAFGVYEPSFTRPLPPGTEAIIIEERNGWRHIRLIDGRETWVPASAIEPV